MGFGLVCAEYSWRVRCGYQKEDRLEFLDQSLVLLHGRDPQRRRFSLVLNLVFVLHYFDNGMLAMLRDVVER